MRKVHSPGELPPNHFDINNAMSKSSCDSNFRILYFVYKPLIRKCSHLYPVRQPREYLLRTQFQSNHIIQWSEKV